MEPSDTSRPSRLTYAVCDTDTARDLHSLDREMTVRLGRTFGLALLAVGGMFLAIMIPAATTARGPVNPLTVFVPLGLCVLPGIIMLCSVPSLRRGSRPAAVVILVTAVWMSLGFAAALAGAAAAVALRGGWADGELLLQLVIWSILLGGAIKLLYHDIRLLIAPGRGASAAALAGVMGSLASGDREAVARALTWLGLFRMITGAALSVTTGVALLLMMLAAPPPPAPPLPPEATAAFASDVYGELGLAAADRAVVIEHLANASGEPLSAEQRERLDAGLREIGKYVVEWAAWPGHRLPAPPPHGPSLLPLSTSVVAERLPIKRAHYRKTTQGGRAMIYAGGWQFSWSPHTWVLNEDHLIWGAATSNRGFYAPVRIFGDLCRGQDLRHDGGWTWTCASIERLLDSARNTPNAPFVTVAQAKTVTESLRARPPDGAATELDHAAPPPTLDATAVMRPDGVLAVKMGSSDAIWVDRDGTRQRTSPEQRVVAAQPPRRLAGNAASAVSVAVVGLVGAAMGLCLAISSRGICAGEARWARHVLAGHVIVTMIGAAALVWFVKDLLERNPPMAKSMWSPAVVVSFAVAILWMSLAGVAAPLVARRRLGHSA
jgi:hypothetical protein